jgi:uncharacterized protein (UPF0548 family)
LPAGYHLVHRRALLGVGRLVFERATHVLSHWGMHRRAGLAVAPSSPVAVTGSVVVLSLGWHRLSITAPCRVVYAVDEPDRRGFAYGTLPGHPERGEESFIVELTPEDEAWFAIRAFSRPVSVLARSAGPMSRWVQNLITNRYIRALSESVRDGPPSHPALGEQELLASEELCRLQRGNAGQGA